MFPILIPSDGHGLVNQWDILPKNIYMATRVNYTYQDKSFLHRVQSLKPGQCYLKSKCIYLHLSRTTQIFSLIPP